MRIDNLLLAATAVLIGSLAFHVTKQFTPDLVAHVVSIALMVPFLAILVTNICDEETGLDKQQTGE